MEETYDVILLGTGLTECVLSGICTSMKKLKVLHMDRNNYYGGEATSLLLDELFRKFGFEAPGSNYGKNRDWNVDLVPKFLMADGKLVQLLVSTGVTSYLEFKCVGGSYVFKNGGIHKIPSTAKEGLTSSLLGLFEKRRFIKFIHFAYDYDERNPKSYSGTNPEMTMHQVFDKFGLDQGTRTFVGHAMALYRDDGYLKENCVPAIKKVRLYLNSIARYGNSPYLYPMYGLGELPQGFARRCAVFGGTYMLNKPIENVEILDDGLVEITSQGEKVRTKKLIADPTYFPDRAEKVGKVIRVVCLLSHPIANTNNVDSCQIIMPQSELKRTHDIYVLLISATQKVSPQGKYIALVSTTVETDDPEKEVQPGLALLGSIDQKFVSISDQYAPIVEKEKDNIFISRSYDATTHFETTCADILDIYKRIFEEEINFDTMREDFAIPEQG